MINKKKSVALTSGLVAIMMTLSACGDSVMQQSSIVFEYIDTQTEKETIENTETEKDTVSIESGTETKANTPASNTFYGKYSDFMIATYSDTELTKYEQDWEQKFFLPRRME